MTNLKILSTAKTTALITFIGGTIILLAFLLTNENGIAFLGLLYAAIAILVNLVVLVILLFNAYKQKIKQNLVFKTVGLMLLNIPVLIVYCWFPVTLMNTLRITFINSTTATLSNIQINGCEQKLISQLLPGQSKTVWINIPTDCGVDIFYKQNGLSKQEDVTGYVTNDGGYIMTFKIGTNQKPYDQDL